MIVPIIKHKIMTMNQKHQETYQNLIQRVQDWMAEAEKTEVNDPNAASFATARVTRNQLGNSDSIRPSVRIVLVKHISVDRHFIIYTNYESRKGQEIEANPFAALSFYWKSTGKQIRVEGQIEPISSQEADEYFASRPRQSQIGAWASQQSRPLQNRDELMQRYHDLNQKYDDQDIPRPPYWSGFRLIPDYIEFWQDGDHRLHHRESFTRPSDRTVNLSADLWSGQLLNP